MTVSSSTGAGGGDAGCYSGPPVALFVLSIRAADGLLPEDTTVTVKWSAGDEPPFILNDQSTWMTLEQGANVVCDVDHDAAAIPEIEELRCELWTSGATEVTVTGGELPPYESTPTPMEQPGCEEPIASEIEIVLDDMPDAGR